MKRNSDHESGDDISASQLAADNTTADNTTTDDDDAQPQPEDSTVSSGDSEEHSVRGIVLDICLIVAALFICIVAFATSSRVSDRTAGLPIPLNFVDESFTAELTVRIDSRNRLIVEQQPLDKYATLRDYIKDKNISPRSVHIVASEGCLVESVLQTIRSLRRCGISDVYLSTSSI